MINYFSNPVNQVSSNRILHTPSGFAKSCLLYLQETGSLTALSKHTSQRASLDSFLFFVVCSGSGSFTYENIEYKLSEGDCVFIDCSKSYSHTTSADNLWNLKWIHFNGVTLSAIYDKYLSRGGKIVFHPESTKDFLILHNEIFNEATKSEHLVDMKINTLLSKLLVHLMENSWNPIEITSKRGKLLPIKVYLDEHYTEKISLDELSNKFYINKFYLTRIFKEQYGVSINNYLLGLKVTKAKQLLRFSEETLENISAKCGIGEANYFSRIFKQIEGISPSEYRKQWNE